MINPVQGYPSGNYYFVKNGVIFDISSSNVDNDSCANEYKQFLPRIVVKKKDGSEGSGNTYYLDCYIERGDICSAITEGEIEFFKTIHSNDSDNEALSSFTEYFMDLCKNKIKERISIFTDEKYDKDYFKNNLSLLEVPRYVVDGETFEIKTVSGGTIDPIDWYNSFDDYKRAGIADRAIDNANSILRLYGLKLKDDFNIDEQIVPIQQ